MVERPNIIFIFPDELRADFLGCYGASFIETPHIDALADRGVLFRQAYSPHPVCVPARVALMTGMNAIANGVLDNGQFLRPDYRACGISTWPELLSQAGYATIAIGKMHFYPWETRLGFQDRIIAEDKIWIHIRDDYYHFLRQHGYAKSIGLERDEFHENYMTFISDIPWECSVDHFVGQESVRWIQDYADDRPFAMMIGFPGPHPPLDPCPQFLDGLDPEDMPEPIPEVPEDTSRLRGRHRRPPAKSWYAYNHDRRPTREHYMLQRSYYAALIRQIDYEVGCILQALRDRGMLENTVIIFSSDHGDYLGDHGLSGKSSFYEASTKVPLMVRLPQAESREVRDDLVTLTDVTPTILQLAGCDIPAYIDALPLPGLGPSDSEARTHIVGALERGWMVYDGEWKLTTYAGGGTLLYNLREDPSELRNLSDSADCLDIMRRLERVLTEEIMHSINISHSDKRLYTRSYSGSSDFGRLGWQWRYPAPIQDTLG